MRAAEKIPKYVDKFLVAVSRLQPVPGTVSVMRVFHDDGCRIWKTGLCTCDPDVELPDWPGRS